MLPSGQQKAEKDTLCSQKIRNTMRIAHTFRGPFLAMRLHGDMCIQVVQGSIRLLASLPPAFVHALNFLITTTRSLVLLRSRDRNKRINLYKNKRLAKRDVLILGPTVASKFLLESQRSAPHASKRASYLALSSLGRTGAGVRRKGVVVARW
jgi:hypothetical protein